VPLIELDTAPVRVTCSVDDCDNDFYGSMMCKIHYQREYRKRNGPNPRRYKAQPDDIEGLWLRIKADLGLYGPSGRKKPI
jgi:hypothetical protein